MLSVSTSLKTWRTELEDQSQEHGGRHGQYRPHDSGRIPGEFFCHFLLIAIIIRVSDYLSFLIEVILPEKENDK